MNKKAKIILAVTIATLLTIVSLYFFAWRPSDNDYITGSALATYTEKTYRVLTVELSAIQYPNQINTATPLKLRVLANSYKNAVDALGQNSAINRDLRVQSTYGKNKDALVEHAQSMITLAESIKLYTAIVTQCGEFTDGLAEKSDSYPGQLADCQSAISDGGKSKNIAFNDLFFSKYRDETSKYIDALDKIMNSPNDEAFEAASKTATAAYEEIYKLGEVKLDFESPNVIAITKDLNAVLESQKKAFFR